jgi:hypothetical protein
VEKITSINKEINELRMKLTILKRKWLMIWKTSEKRMKQKYKTKWKAIVPKITNETRSPILPTPIQHSPQIPSQRNQTRRRNKRIQIGKETVKISLFAR